MIKHAIGQQFNEKACKSVEPKAGMKSLFQ